MAERYANLRITSQTDAPLYQWPLLDYQIFCTRSLHAIRYPLLSTEISHIFFRIIPINLGNIATLNLLLQYHREKIFFSTAQRYQVQPDHLEDVDLLVCHLRSFQRKNHVSFGSFVWRRCINQCKPRRPFVWEISRPSLFDIEICFPTLKQENDKIFKIHIIFLIRMLFLSHIVVWYVSYLGSSSLLGFGCAMGITSTSCAPHVVCFCARRRSQLYMIFSRYLAVILP